MNANELNELLLEYHSFRKYKNALRNSTFYLLPTKYPALLEVREDNQVFIHYPESEDCPVQSLNTKRDLDTLLLSTIFGATRKSIKID